MGIADMSGQSATCRPRSGTTVVSIRPMPEARAMMSLKYIAQ